MITRCKNNAKCSLYIYKENRKYVNLSFIKSQERERKQIVILREQKASEFISFYAVLISELS